MKVAFFIAKKISFNRSKSLSRFIIRLATTATALSVAAMILTIAFVNGFQQTVSEKVFGFWGHIRIQQYEPAKALIAEESPITENTPILKKIKQLKEVQHVNAFATKSAVIENKGEIEGILFKGVDRNYRFQNMKPFLTEGRWIAFNDSSYSKEITVPAAIAAELNIALNDTVALHFISAEKGKTFSRKLKVVGIYKTGIEEFDKLFAVGDIDLIRRLNNWSQQQVGGYEVLLSDYKMMANTNEEIYLMLPDRWVSRTIKDVYPNIFDWLSIQDVNRDVIFIIMSIVAIINLITCLLILVLERTKMVGILKAVGGSNALIQRIFLLHATYIAAIGVTAGFLFGVGLCFLQQKTGFIRLDEASYYVSTAPVAMMWGQFFLVAASTLVVCFLALIIPANIVRTIRPVKAVQFN